jgi:hypothetical protein
VSNFEEMRLSLAGENLLRNSPEDFLAAYGEYFVAEIWKGGSFFSSIRITDDSSSSSNSLDVFASVSTPFGGGSAGYSSAYEEHSSMLSIEADGRVRGGSLPSNEGDSTSVIFDAGDPDSMMLLHNQWLDTLNDSNALEQRVVFKRWWDLHHVQEMVVEHHPDKLGLFIELPDVTQETFRRYTEGRTFLHRAQDSVGLALQWDCMMDNRDEPIKTAYENLLALSDYISSDLNALLQLQESDLQRFQFDDTVAEEFNKGRRHLESYEDIYFDTLRHYCQAPTPSPPTPSPDVLHRGEKLRHWESLRSENGRFILTFQGDGNLVGTDTSSGGIFWSTETHGRGGQDFSFQGDGNCVVYVGGGQPIWSTGTAGTDGYRFVMQNDRNVVLYGHSGPLWGSNTAI